MRIRKQKTWAVRPVGRLPGMTLLELSIVTMFAAVLFTFLFAFYNQVSAVTQRAGDVSQKKKQFYRVFNQMIRDLDHVLYIPSFKSTQLMGFADKGTVRKDRISFTFVDPDVNLLNFESEAKEATYYLMPDDQDGEDYMLVKREDAVIDHEPDKGGIHHILLRNVTELEITYAFRRRGDTWEDEWDSKKRNTLPRRIKVRLGLNLGGDEPVYLEGQSVPGILSRYQ